MSFNSSRLLYGTIYFFHSKLMAKKETLGGNGLRTSDAGHRSL